ncbi:MAG: glycosyltransferase [bacterium]|nr:glycosyltransferase [bacterium]
MRVALVHDHLNQYGGGERVLSVFAEMFPYAPIFTLVYDEQLTGHSFHGKEIHTSFIQKIPWAKRNHRLWPVLMPLGVEKFDLSRFDLVISNSASFAKGIITKPKTKHIAYCLTPTRFLWDDSHKYIEEFQRPWIVKKLTPFLLNYLRIWDQEASHRVDQFVAISQFIKARVKKYYQREAEVIYPPVETKRFKISPEVDKYFLMVGRMVPYKRFELAVKVFNELGWPLKIIGDGPQKKYLQKIAKPNIEFLGLISDHLLPAYYARAQALIFPQEEDFGIVVVEAMASGRPVVAFRGGGSLETIKEGESGVFFDEQTEESLLKTLRQFNPANFDSQQIRARSMLFDREIFKEKFEKVIREL